MIKTKSVTWEHLLYTWYGVSSQIKKDIREHGLTIEHIDEFRTSTTSWSYDYMVYFKSTDKYKAIRYNSWTGKGFEYHEEYNSFLLKGYLIKKALTDKIK